MISSSLELSQHRDLGEAQRRERKDRAERHDEQRRTEVAPCS
jgi:hypothetical protein